MRRYRLPNQPQNWLKTVSELAERDLNHSPETVLSVGGVFYAWWLKGKYPDAIVAVVERDPLVVLTQSLAAFELDKGVEDQTIKCSVFASGEFPKAKKRKYLFFQQLSTPDLEKPFALDNKMFVPPKISRKIISNYEKFAEKSRRVDNWLDVVKLLGIGSVPKTEVEEYFNENSGKMSVPKIKIHEFSPDGENFLVAPYSDPMIYILPTFRKSKFSEPDIIVCGDYFRMQPLSKKFDLVISNNVYDHLSVFNGSKLGRKVADEISDGGILEVTAFVVPPYGGVTFSDFHKLRLSKEPLYEYPRYGTLELGHNVNLFQKCII